MKTDFSNTYFFSPSVTDRSESINQYLGSVNLTPIDIVKTSFETENDTAFNPAKLNKTLDEEKVMANAVVKMLKKIADISNSSIVMNADGLLSNKPTDMNVEWIRKKNAHCLVISIKSPINIYFCYRNKCGAVAC